MLPTITRSVKRRVASYAAALRPGIPCGVTAHHLDPTYVRTLATVAALEAHLARASKRHGEGCHPGNDGLAQLLDVCDRTVQRHIRVLERTGVLDVSRPVGGRPGGTGHASVLRVRRAGWDVLKGRELGPYQLGVIQGAAPRRRGGRRDRAAAPRQGRHFESPTVTPCVTKQPKADGATAPPHSGGAAYGGGHVGSARPSNPTPNRASSALLRVVAALGGSDTPARATRQEPDNRVSPVTWEGATPEGRAAGLAALRAVLFGRSASGPDPPT